MVFAELFGVLWGAAFLAMSAFLLRYISENCSIHLLNAPVIIAIVAPSLCLMRFCPADDAGIVILGLTHTISLYSLRAEKSNILASSMIVSRSAALPIVITRSIYRFGVMSSGIALIWAVSVYCAIPTS